MKSLSLVKKGECQLKTKFLFTFLLLLSCITPAIAQRVSAINGSLSDFFVVKQTVTSLRDFSGGMNSSASIFGLKENEGLRCENWQLSTIGAMLSEYFCLHFKVSFSIISKQIIIYCIDIPISRVE